MERRRDVTALTAIEYFIDHMNKKSQDVEAYRDLKNKKVVVQVSLRSYSVVVRGDTPDKTVWNTAKYKRDDDFFREELAAIDRLNSEGYNISYEGPRSLKEWGELLVY